MTQYFIAVDIGGTKTAVSRWISDGEMPVLEDKIRFATPVEPGEGVALICDAAKKLSDGYAVVCAGISCGGPLDSRKGLILAPPNLPKWDGVDICTAVREACGAPAYLQNDANACALAEWLWGAGKGTQNMVFLTFGTGMGSGLILDGRLYSGTNDMAGEVGHMRIEHDGPEGYYKKGSFEGFCSGGGIARLAKMRLPAFLTAGGKTVVCDDENLSAKSIAEAAEVGDAFAKNIITECGQKLGMGLSVIIDLFNPEKIVIGSIYGRVPALAPIARSVIDREALSYAARVCEICPAGLGESVGDYAGIAIAINNAK
ncbi:MAG: ROK family protein [Clostridia bacterium]|nr:ROK family protein [Clostridia bacterium]